MKVRTSRSITALGPAKLSVSRAAIASSSPPTAISRTTAAAVGLSAKTFSERVSKSTPPNFSSRNLTNLVSRMVIAPRPAGDHGVLFYAAYHRTLSVTRARAGSAHHQPYVTETPPD